MEMGWSLLLVGRHHVLGHPLGDHLLALRYLQGGWQEKRVIEPIVID
jgi:hypothetical protein